MDDKSRSAALERAMALHQAGEFAQAAAIYETLLRTETTNADLFWLLSLAQLRLGKTEQAITSWRKSLSLEAAIPLKFRTIASFLLSAQQTVEADIQASDLFDGLQIPDWPRGLPLDQDGRSMIAGLAECLIDFGREKAAVRLIDGLLAQYSADPDFLIAAAPAMVHAGESQKILELLRPLTSGVHRDNGALLIVHAAAASAAGEQDEAINMSLRSRRAVPVFLSPEKPHQRFVVGVLNPAPEVVKNLYSPSHFHFHGNTPATLAARMNDEFRFLSIFPQADEAREALTALPQPQLIINNWVNPELLSKDDVLEFVADYADSLKLPVINHPRRAHLTTRQRNAERLAGIPNLLVPRLLRVPNEPQLRQQAIRLIGEQLGFPVIIRSPFTQMGKATVKIETPDDLAAHMSTAKSAQLYAIQYIDNRLPEGAYRKFRAAVIGGELIVIHARFAGEWNVHRTKDARARAKLMEFDAKGTAMAFAEAAVRSPAETFGQPAMAALHEIAARTPLDFFGIDFDLLRDGRILFFEANAAMDYALKEKEYPPEIIVAVKGALRRLFENMVAAPQQQPPRVS